MAVHPHWCPCKQCWTGGPSLPCPSIPIPPFQDCHLFHHFFSLISCLSDTLFLLFNYLHFLSSPFLFLFCLFFSSPSSSAIPFILFNHFFFHAFSSMSSPYLNPLPSLPFYYFLLSPIPFLLFDAPPSLPCNPSPPCPPLVYALFLFHAPFSSIPFLLFNPLPFSSLSS